MSGVRMLHFLKDWWKFIQIHQYYTMALLVYFVSIHALLWKANQSGPTWYPFGMLCTQPCMWHVACQWSTVWVHIQALILAWYGSIQQALDHIAKWSTVARFQTDLAYKINIIWVLDPISHDQMTISGFFKGDLRYGGI